MEHRHKKECRLGNPRGRRTAGKRLEIGSLSFSTRPEHHERLIVTVKTAGRNVRDQWHKLCEHLGIYRERAEWLDDEGKVWGATTAFDCVIPKESLDELLFSNLVVSYHALISVHLPYIGTGRGTEKVKGKSRPSGRPVVPPANDVANVLCRDGSRGARQKEAESDKRRAAAAVDVRELWVKAHE